jgi:nucleotide-binding universal stress UspA family protein
MFSLSRILMPIDFSERCLGGVRYAIPLAERFRSELTLLHVVPPIDYPSPEIRAINETRRREASEQLENVLCVELMHLNVRRMVCEGDPAETITEQACHGRSDLIMMPTHGYGPFRRLLLGSVTSKVLHDTPCAVWTGAHVEQGPSADRLNFNNVVCAVDLGAHGPRVLQWAANLAKEFNSRLTLVHVIPRLDSPGELYYGNDRRQRLLAEIAAAVEKIRQTVGVHVETVLESGEVPKAVRTAAERLNADLVVIGRGAADNGRMRTHTYGIIRESPCPVVSV